MGMGTHHTDEKKPAQGGVVAAEMNASGRECEAITPDWRAIERVIKTEPMFTLHMPDGRSIRLFADGPEGIEGTGIRFENGIWKLLLLLPREAYI